MPESQLAKLVKVLFLVSPNYYDEFKNIKHYKHDGEDCVEATRPDDEKDTLSAWLENNSIRERINRSGGGTTLGFYKFMGENGVYCEIAQKKVHEQNNRLQNFRLGEYGNYRRAVRVISMPSSRGLPPELSSAFVSRGYEIAMRDSWEVKILLSF